MRDIEHLTILLETVPESGVIVVVFQQFVNKIFDGWSECFIIILPIAVDEDVPILKSGFVAIEGYLLDRLLNIWHVVVGVELEELN